jgi:hypothetical protein
MGKRRSEVKLSIWLSTTKSQESLWFLCVQVACHILLESSRQGYNFAWNLTSIGGLHTKLWDSKIIGIPILGISGLPLESPRTKSHLGAGPMAMHRVYYKGEDGGFPQVPAMVSLVNFVSSCLLVAYPCTKIALIMHWPTCYLVCAGLWE